MTHPHWALLRNLPDLLSQVTFSTSLFNDLIEVARFLAQRHATTEAYRRALRPKKDDPNAVPLGSPWPSTPISEPADSDIEMEAVDEEGDHPGEFNNVHSQRDMVARDVQSSRMRGHRQDYSLYLLELYCNFKWEFSPRLRDAILMNWVVNLHGKPGMFIEMDLMQEHLLPAGPLDECSSLPPFEG